MTEIARLQFKRDRLLAAGLAACLLLSLPIAALATRGEGLSQYALQATVIFWVVLGVPGFAVLFGGSAGSQLASAPARGAELLLPVSAQRRAWGAALGAAVHSAALAALAVGVAFAYKGIAPGDDSLSDLLFGGISWWLGEPWHVLAFFGALPYFLLTSLLGAYLFGHGVVGGVLGCLLGGGLLGSAFLGLSLQLFHPERVGFSGWTAFLAIASPLGAGYALQRLAPWVERKERLGAWRVAGLAGLAAAGALGGGAALWWTSWSLKPATSLVDADYRFQLSLPEPRAVAEGAVLLTLGGDLIWTDAEGNRRVLARNRGFDTLIPSFPHQSMVEDERGRVWVLLEEATRRPGPRRFAVWSGEPREGLEVVSRFTLDWNWAQLVRKGAEVGLMTWERGYAALPPLGKEPIWDGKAMVSHGVRSVLEGWVAAGWAASVGRDGRSLEWLGPGNRKVRWALPGWAQFREARAVTDRVGPADAPVFLVRLDGPKGAGLARCFPDGTVKIDWLGTALLPSLAPVPGGGYELDDGSAGSLRFIGEDASLSAPMDRRGRFAFKALRYDGKRAWFLEGGRLLERQVPSGRALRTTPVAAPHRHRGRQLRVVKDGFFQHNGSELEFVRWDGGRNALGR